MKIHFLQLDFPMIVILLLLKSIGSNKQKCQLWYWFWVPQFQGSSVQSPRSQDNDDFACYLRYRPDPLSNTRLLSFFSEFASSLNLVPVTTWVGMGWVRFYRSHCFALYTPYLRHALAQQCMVTPLCRSTTTPSPAQGNRTLHHVFCVERSQNQYQQLT